jgi:steroid delta-isomerase-like uncharacterized protein
MAQPEMRSIVDVAKASVNAYNEKDWEKVRSVLTPDCTYEEVATDRRSHGVNDTIALWQGWAKAMPDSRATFDRQLAKDNTVVLEITWRGTHTGPLPTPRGEIAPTGRSFALKACQIIEVSGERTKAVRHYFDMNTLFQQLNISL